MGLACDWGSWGHGTFLLNSGRVPIDPLNATSCDRLVGKNASLQIEKRTGKFASSQL